MSYDLNPTPDQTQIRDAADALLAEHFPLARLRSGRRDDLTPLAEFGTFALSLPEAEGGAGFSLLEEALLHARLGRAVLSPSALAMALAPHLGATGPLCAAIATPDALLLADATGAERALVFAPDAIELVQLPGQTGAELPGLGHGAPLRRVARADCPVLARDSALRQRADLLICAWLLGLAEASRDLAVDYAGLRQQFGRPIGSFQAIKHHCANMAVNAESLSAQLDMAAIRLRDGAPDAGYQLAALRLIAPQRALANARLCIQIHGGIGFSDEADAHLHLKQAHLLDHLLGAETILDLPAPLAPHPRRPGAST